MAKSDVGVGLAAVVAARGDDHALRLAAQPFRHYTTQREVWKQSKLLNYKCVWLQIIST